MLSERIVDGVRDGDDDPMLVKRIARVNPSRHVDDTPLRNPLPAMLQVLGEEHHIAERGAEDLLVEPVDRMLQPLWWCV